MEKEKKGEGPPSTKQVRNIIRHQTGLYIIRHQTGLYISDTKQFRI